MQSVHMSRIADSFRTCRFRSLDAGKRGIIRERMPGKEVSGSSYVIFSGKEGKNCGSRYLVYNEPHAAFVVNESPATLCLRGDVIPLDKKEIYYIPSDKRLLLKRRRNYLAAAAFLLCLTAGLYYLFFQKDPIYDTLNNGYRSFAQLPVEYRNRIPEDLRDVLHASNSVNEESTFFERRDRAIYKFCVSVFWEKFCDKNLLAFYSTVIADDRYSDETRTKAFDCLLFTAKRYNMHEIAFRYRDHSIKTIRERASFFESKYK